MIAIQPLLNCGYNKVVTKNYALYKKLSTDKGDIPKIKRIVRSILWYRKESYMTINLRSAKEKGRVFKLALKEILSAYLFKNLWAGDSTASVSWKQHNAYLR